MANRDSFTTMYNRITAQDTTYQGCIDTGEEIYLRHGRTYFVWRSPDERIISIQDDHGRVHWNPSV